MSTTQTNSIDLSALDLKNSTFQIGSDVIRIQGQSLVILRQAPLNILDDALSIADSTATHQKTVNSFANYYLDTIVAKIIHSVTEISSLANLFLALDKVKPDSNDALIKILKTVVEQIEKIRLNNSDLIEALSVFSKNCTNEFATYKKEVSDLIAKLDGDEGAINKAKEAISETNALLDKNIQEIIDNANIIGDGVKDLVTYALTVISSSSSKDKSKDKTEDKEKSEDKKEEFDPYPVESVGAVSNGVSGVSEAVTAYQKNLKKVAELYQDFAELNALLSALTSIEEQSSQYSTLISNLLTNYKTFDSSVAAIINNLNEYISELSSNNVSVTEFFTAYDDSVKYWYNLNDNVREIESAFAGSGLLFPQVQSI